MNILSWYENARLRADNCFIQALESQENYSARLKHLVSQRNVVAFLGFVMSLCSCYILLQDTSQNMQRITGIPSTFVLCFTGVVFAIAVKMDLDNQIKTLRALKYLKELQKLDS